MKPIHYKVARVALFLPFRVLRFLSLHFPIGIDDDDGWNMWIHADYCRYCRFDMSLWGWRGP